MSIHGSPDVEGGLRGRMTKKKDIRQAHARWPPGAKSATCRTTAPQEFTNALTCHTRAHLMVVRHQSRVNEGCLQPLTKDVLRLSRNQVRRPGVNTPPPHPSLDFAAIGCLKNVLETPSNQLHFDCRRGVVVLVILLEPSGVRSCIACRYDMLCRAVFQRDRGLCVCELAASSRR